MYCIYFYDVSFVFLVLFFSHSVDALVEESGCSLENLATAKFRMCVIAGNWKQVNKNFLYVNCRQYVVASLVVDNFSHSFYHIW